MDQTENIISSTPPPPLPPINSFRTSSRMITLSLFAPYPSKSVGCRLLIRRLLGVGLSNSIAAIQDGDMSRCSWLRPPPADESSSQDLCGLRILMAGREPDKVRPKLPLPVNKEMTFIQIYSHVTEILIVFCILTWLAEKD